MSDSSFTRPLSPRSTSSSNNEPSSLRRVLSSIFSTGSDKQNSHKRPTHITDEQQKQQDSDDLQSWRMTMSIANEPLNNSFEASKKRRMSTLQAMKEAPIISGTIPRSASIIESTSGLFGPGSSAGGSGSEDIRIGTGGNINLLSMPGGYSSFYSAKKNQEDSINDLEQRRRSIIDRDLMYYAAEASYGGGTEPDQKSEIQVDTDDNDEELEVNNDNKYARMVSPMDGVLTQPAAPLPTLEPYHQTEQEFLGGGDDLPLIIEHEFAPLYRDANGNLVRPPFINLDPRERYQLLQLKKSIEASEALQSKLKYISNPMETVSKRIPNTNKVETSTQTHDLDYLSNTLHFLKKRKLEKQSGSGRSKKQKNSKGYFLCDFDYEVEEEKKVSDKKASSKAENLAGYLGEVKQPDLFKSKKTASTDSKSTSQRFGLDDILSGRNSSESLKLDAEYLESTKLREDLLRKERDFSATPATAPSKPPAESLFAPAKQTQQTTTPSAVPTFSFGKSNNNTAPVSKGQEEAVPKRKRSLDDEESSSSKPDLFGAKKPEESAASKSSLFNFGATTKPSSSSASSQSATPKFSFNVPSKTPTPGLPSESKPQEAAKLSFGATAPTEKPTLPSFAFGGSKSDTNAASKAPSLFGSIPKADSSSSGTPSFSFGSTTADKPSAAKPAEGESTKPKLPAFNFGGATPASSADKKEEAPKPAFSFGSTDKKDETAAPKPAFSFGAASAEKKDDAPKPSFSFGAPPATEKKDEAAAPKPAFTFGSTTPAAATEKKNDAPQTTPLFSFGGSATSEKKDASALGAPSEEKKDAPKPAFSFGATAPPTGEAKTDSAVPKPAFSFGTSTIPSISTPTGKVADSTGGPKPTFDFGSTAKPSTPFASTSTTTDQSKHVNFGSTDQAAKKPTFSFGAAAVGDASSAIVGSDSTSKSNSPAPFSFTAGNKVETPKPVSSTFSFGNTASTSFAPPTTSASAPASTAFGAKPATANTSGAPVGAGFGATPAFNLSTPPFGQSQPQKPFSFGSTPNFAGGLQQQQPNSGASPQAFNFSSVSNPNSREVSPAFNFQASQQQQQPNGFPMQQQQQSQQQTPIQPSLVPNINFSGTASSDPSAIFSSTTPPPTTGTPPIMRNRKIAQARSRRR